MTPNHFTKPIQGSRSVHDYGNTRIERTPPWRGQVLPMLGVALLMSAVMAGVVLGFVAMGGG